MVIGVLLVRTSANSEKLSELRHRRAEARCDGYALMRVTRTCLSVDFKSTKCDIKKSTRVPQWHAR